MRGHFRACHGAGRRRARPNRAKGQLWRTVDAGCTAGLALDRERKRAKNESASPERSMAGIRGRRSKSGQRFDNCSGHVVTVSSTLSAVAFRSLNWLRGAALHRHLGPAISVQPHSRGGRMSDQPTDANYGNPKIAELTGRQRF